MLRLSLFELDDREGVVEGREMRPEPDWGLLDEEREEAEVEALVRMEGRFFGAVGACWIVSFCFAFISRKLRRIYIPCL